MPAAETLLAPLGRLVAVIDPAGIPALGDRWQRAVDDLVRFWLTGVQPEQLDAAVRQIELAAAHDNLEALTQLHVPVLGERELDAAMRELAAAGAAAVTAEAGAQGAPVEPAPPLASSRLADWARATARRLADAFAATLSREALRLLRPGAAPATVGAGVRTYAAALTDTGPRVVLGGALTLAQNLGRLSVYDRPPVGWKVRLFADETLDTSTCKLCKEINGTELPTLDAAMLAYGGAGYLYCLGRERCRGTMTGVWTKLDPGDPGVQALHRVAALALEES